MHSYERHLPHFKEMSAADQMQFNIEAKPENIVSKLRLIFRE